ncbi:MAG: protein kinase [Planctomycetota bacterium]|nr:protein kinase [Planctomycetota bacterium]
MTLKALCHHGHKFEAPQHAERKAVCPLCGAVTRFQGRVETKGSGALDQTINLPDSGRAETTRGENLDQAADGDTPSSGARALLQTVAPDERANADAPGSDTQREAAGRHTVAFDKTLNLEGPPAAANDVASEGLAQTVSFDKTLNLVGKTGEPEDPDESRNVAKTMAIGETVNLDRPPLDIDSVDEPRVVSATIDASNVPTAGDRMASPTGLLQTLDSKSPPVVEDKSSEQKPPAPPAPAVESEFKPPNLPGYKVVSELGRGGMGVVYRARHEKRNRDVALKTLLHISPVELQRFKQEFRSLADIAHPNLAALYDLLSDGETWCFSMEILEAVDFTEYVLSGFEARQRKRGQILVGTVADGQPRLTAPIKERLYEGLKQLVLGLNTLHQAGMLHRDIKPSNVLVTTEGRVVLVDFGLASQFEEGSAERPIGIQGTPEYMAPEQAACNPLSPASDWYAVGVMLYEVLTGYFPIVGKPLQVIFKKQTDTPKEPRELEPTVPGDLNDLCVALLDKDQAKRPTATDVLRWIGAEALIESLHTTARVGSGQTFELVGREGHLQGLRTSFRQVKGGTAKTIFVHGKSGMGKSVLIQKFLEGIRGEDQAVVLSGRCYEQESVPFKALDSLIDSLADHLTGLPEPEVRAATPDDLLPLVRLFPVLGQIPGASDPGRPSIENVDQQELRQRAMNALRELLKRLGQRKPIVLYIDDLQWGDEDSADLLADLVRPPEAPRVLVLGSYRTENRDTSHCLKALDKAYTTGQHRPHREEIAVDSLQEEDAQRLALMLLGRDDKEAHVLAGKIARESRGWPFFVWELAQHVQDTPEIADQSLELDEVIWTRVNRLPAETRRLLELVAVTGRPIPALEAYQAIDGLEKGQSFLAQLRTRNFVRTTESDDEDTIVETYHDRIRESVVDHLDRPTVQAHSLNLALTIEKVSGIKVADLRAHIDKTPEFEAPEETYELQKQQWQRVFDLAYFFDAAGKHDRACPFALCAAEQARKQDAQEVAEQQFRIALRGAGQLSTAIRFRVHEGLGDVLVLRGKYGEANEQFEAARLLAQGSLVLARIDWKLGVAAFKMGDMGDARDYLEKSITALGERPPNKLTVVPRLVKEASRQVLHTKFPARYVGRDDPNSEQGQLDLFRARVYDQLTITYWFTRGMKFVLWSHLRQMNLAERYPHSPELGKTYAFHAIAMTGLPLAKRGINYAKQAYDISVDKGDLWGQGKARSFHTFSCIVLATFKEGIETGAEAVRLLEQAGDIWEANMARMIRSVPMYHAGDLKGAYREAKKAYEIGIETGDYSAACIALLFWIPAAPHTIPPGAIKTEMERERFDPLAITSTYFTRGLELLLTEDKPQQAADMLQKMLDEANRREFRDCCLFAAVTWKATACRIVAEREPAGAARSRAIRKAKKAVRKALNITKSYRACRPHALREAGIVAAMEGKEDVARRLFDESLQVATDHEALYDHARTMLARGEAGLRFGWPDAERQVAEAKSLIAEIENVEQA